MSFLSGLDKFGLGNLKSEKVFEEKPQEKPKEVEKPKVVSASAQVVDEKSLVFEKKYICPVCETEFTSLTVRTGKVHVKEIEIDLHPIYDLMDELKYDIVACPDCGYAALARYFASVTRRQIDNIRQKVCMNYKPNNNYYEKYTYQDAVDRYQLALANAIVKDAKASEKAYLCLRYSWLLRGILKQDPSERDESYTKEKLEELESESKELLKLALDGFVDAKQKESFPIAGMNTITFDYLLAALFYENGDYSSSKRLIGELLVSRSAPSSIKERARDIKDLIAQKEGRNQIEEDDYDDA
ncbi:DUF2225 domain-containing protein [Butyrivibrio sp. MC2013]|uniref:DUF2225 domain-containing protein n=1 Tax=Butyrivibrio sp. MC2013 TaxID=1280686 RepID=UPI0004194C6A|nr:DUF2225 domain-containing protein [Butyrivibrio sp. MC2013]